METCTVEEGGVIQSARASSHASERPGTPARPGPSKSSERFEGSAAAGADDVALVRACQAGDEQAWRRLYEAQFPFVYRTARRLGIAAHEAEDVAHDVFVVAHRRLADFREGRVSTWLYRMTAHIASNRHRRRRVRERLADFIPSFGAADPRPDELSERRSDRDAVDRVLARMSPKKREVFALFELEQLEGEEIAERVGCPLNTVWSRLHHARKEFVHIAKKLGVLEEVGA